MGTNIITLKLHRQYLELINNLNIRNQDLKAEGIKSIDYFIRHIHMCHSSINNIVLNKSNRTKRKRYEKTFGEFKFKLIIYKDLNCEFDIELIKKVTKKVDEKFLKSMYAVNGYVYFLKSDYGCKIGCTKDINRRFKELDTLMPFELKLHSFIKIQNYRGLESFLHEALKDKRLNGEWFELDNEDFKYIDEIAKLHNVKRECENKLEK